MLVLQGTYPNDYDRMQSPVLSNYMIAMIEGKVKRLSSAKAGTISKCTIGLESIQSKYMQKDLELQSKDCEGYEQLSEGPSSRCCRGFGFAVEEDIKDGQSNFSGVMGVPESDLWESSQ